MKKLKVNERKTQLRALAAMNDKDVNTSDIPELTEEQLRSGVRGALYRPIKRPVTMRLDADVIEWLRQDGPGYQTKANRLLRSEMIRSSTEKKNVRASSGMPSKRSRKSGT
jgi:uncharacterized protein (DUF4415 family)